MRYVVEATLPDESEQLADVEAFFGPTGLAVESPVEAYTATIIIKVGDVPYYVSIDIGDADIYPVH